MGVGAVIISAGLYWFFSIRPYETTDNAYLKANSTLLSAKVGGYVTSVPVTDNQHVNQGDIIAEIDPRDYQARVDHAEAQVAATKAALKRLEMQRKAQDAAVRQTKAAVVAAAASQKQAQADFERISNLVDSGAVSRKDYDGAEAQSTNASASVKMAESAHEAAGAQLEAVQAQLEEINAQLRAAQASLSLARLDLEHTRIVAPKAGVVGNKAAHVGQLVRPGTAIGYFVPDHEFWVEANFKETQIQSMKPGQSVVMTIDAYPGEKFTGHVDSLSPASGAEYSILPPENATGNFTKIVRRIPVKLSFEASQKLPVLRPGMSVYVRVRTK